MEQAVIKEALINKANIRDLEASNAKIENLQVKAASIESAIIGVAYISDLTAINANIQNLIAADAKINTALINKADITELNAVQGNITSLNSQIANIQTLVNGNLSSENIQAGGITSDKLTIANGFITNAMIANLDVSKINAGDISTNKFRIVSDSGKMLIADNTIQIRDKNRVRVQIGKDGSNDYNMYVWDSSGKIMFDATGLKADGIKNKIIRDDMISDTANIDGAKININSLITEINKDTNTSVIKSSKVQIDSLKQTLDVAFNFLKSNVDNTEIVGRNLLKNSNPKDNTYWREASGGTGTRSIINISDAPLSGITKGFQFAKDSGFNNIDYSQDNVRVVKGKTYTMSCYARCISGSAKLRLQYGKKPYPRKEIIINSTDNSKWEKYTFTFKFNEDTNSLTNIYFGAGSTQGTIQVCGMLLQEGAKSGTWVYAPEDIDSSIEFIKEITESNSTTINVMQGQINAAINNTQIVKDGKTILLKDDYNRTISKVDSINSTIGTHTTKINELTGNIISVDTKVNSVQRNIEGTKSTVSSHTNLIDGLNSKLSTQGSSIEQLKNQITLKVNSTELNAAINKKANSTDVYTKTEVYTKAQTDSAIKIAKDSIELGVKNTYETKTNVESKISTAVNNVQVGGTNIIKGTNTISQIGSSGTWSAGTWRSASGGTGTREIVTVSSSPNPNIKKGIKITTTSSTTGNTDIAQDGVPVTNGATYTLSCYVRKISGDAELKLQYGKNPYPAISTKITSTSWTKFSYTFTIGKVSDGSTKGSTNIYFGLKSGLVGSAEMCGFKLEYGNKATDWTPAPEDFQGQLDTKANSTDVYTKTETYTKSETDSKITVAKDSINLSVSGTYETKTNVESKINTAKSNAINSAKSYTDGQITTVNKTITNKVSEIKATTDSIFFKK